MKKIAVVLTLVTLGMSTVQAVPATSTGHIVFNGAIVEDACHINQQQAQMQITCLSGTKQTTETLNLKQLVNQSPLHLIASQVSYLWIDLHHTMAVITISHK